ncbi:hypothetical protein BEL04_22205 [Mucilaginibacter sp. PPCGB 2223]|uniref:DUF5676 family membrane protein n=1 Tax=Mucilaginibacter sp. PPCGB 2223 TaxID=1886027 RepID=UPI000824E974|nr:DUF5676 family membrane protein [Mucilaginibacter sp. PPCGB 2223]OCX50495.1 hypothetical protein BEL04_22205 [Mucilaginibacter sp. PPCGB 2223]
MQRIIVKKLGFAFGVTASLVHISCILLMATIGKDNSVKFFNSIIHGMDFSTVVRTGIPFSEAAIGVAEVFIISWLIGACIAAFYNASIRNDR